MKQCTWSHGLLMALAISFSWTLLADETAKATKKSPPAAKEKTPPKSNDDSDEDSDAAARYTVPDTDVAGLLKFIEGLRKFMPNSNEEAILHRSKGPAAMQQAAEKIVSLEKDKSSEAYRTAKYITLSFALRDLADASDEERQTVVNDVAAFINESTPGIKELQLAMQTASALENEDSPLAAKTYQQFGELFAKSKDKKIAENSAIMLGAARRLQLPGHTMKLEAKTVGGKSLNLADMQGKVVLIDFWATWCGPCLAEIPNMKKLYEKYHDRGFEIVGLSIDQDREALDAFLEKRKLPWTIAYDAEHEGQHPALKHYGIFGIPTMILVGRDGKVLDIHARGEHLEEELAKQFSDKGESDSPTDATASEADADK